MTARSSMLPVALVGVVGLGVVARAQVRFQAAGPDVAPPNYTRIDDQLIDMTDRVVVDGRIKARPQGATVDRVAIPWVTRFTGWDFGVVPIQFSPEITSAHRDDFMQACRDWGQYALVTCILRTSQNGYLTVAQDSPDPSLPSGCYSSVGQARRLVSYILHLSPECWNERNVHHELGHAFGFIHEHQRPDRDAYIVVDLSNVPADAQYAFAKLSLLDHLLPYDFGSVMHYRNNAFAIDSSKPTIIPQSGYGSYASTMGTASLPSPGDADAIGSLYRTQLVSLGTTAPSESPRTRFDRTDFLDAMERLHAFYFARAGLNRPAGLSINGRPDFTGIATWIFDIYLAARSRGFSAEQSFGMVVADITQSDEWRGKHAGSPSLTRPSFTPVVSFSRAELLDALQQLDAFYAAPAGLRRPDGLSISGGPDFLGIAAWIFDVYLNERLSGGSSTVAWQRVVNAIQSTPEWKSKH